MQDNGFMQDNRAWNAVADKKPLGRDKLFEVIRFLQCVFKTPGPVTDQAAFEAWYARTRAYDEEVFVSAVNAYVQSGKAVFDLDAVCAAVDAYAARREDFKKLVMVLGTAYPKMFADRYAFELWLSNLLDIDYRFLEMAVKNYIQSNHFPPTIADIRMTAARLMEKDEPVPALEWQRLKKALGSAYAENAEDVYNALNDVTKECIGGFGGFRELAMMDINSLEKITRPMFVKEFTLRNETRLRRKSVSAGCQLPSPGMERYIETADRHLPLEQKREEHPDSGKVHMPPHLREQLYRRLGWKDRNF